MMNFFCHICVLLFLIHYALANSCAGRCGDGVDSSEQCQCNEPCVNFGDCCDDYEELCLSTGSCAGRCGDGVDSSEQCQCNEPCVSFGDCCDDYEELCLSSSSCEGRCGEDYNPDNDCHCNSLCSDYNNCCDDYTDICGGSDGVTDAELLEIGEILWSLDTNRLPDNGYTIDTDGPEYFTYVDESHLSDTPTFSKFLALFDNYNPNVGEAEGSCSSCETEISAFLDAVFQTSLMQRTWQFLADEGLAADSLNGFKDELYQYWFAAYGRSSSGPVDSSGFEHVLIGELDGSSVSGFHNWVRYYVEERDGNLELSQQTGNCEPDYVKLAFDWYGKYKSGATLFLAVSPEFDLATYTICFLTRRNSQCTLSFDGRDVRIQTYDMPNADFLAVGTAYPIC